MKKILSPLERQMLMNDLGKIATWSISPDGEVWWCEAMYDLYGMKKGDDITVEGFKEKVFSKDYINFENTINQAVRDKKNFEVKARIFIKDAYHWVNIRGRVLKDGSIVGITQNIEHYYRELNSLKLDMEVIKVLSAKKDKSVERIHNILHNV